MVPGCEDHGAGACAHAQASAPTIADLPNDVLLNCLERLYQDDRYKNAAQVCKRWREVCMSPQLLRSVHFWTGRREAVARLQALLQLLQAHGAHVHVLSLNNFFAEWFTATMEEEEEAARVVSACMHACAAAGALRELRFNCSLHGLGMSWLPQCTSLTRLVTRDCLHGCPPEVLDLRHLALTDASIGAPPGHLQLPPTLTALSLDNCDKLPSQMSQLTCLARLVVCCADGQKISFEGILPHLTSLTRLEFYSQDVPGRLPSAVTALRSLRQLSYSTGHALFEGVDFRLQPGPWLAGVEWLCLPWATLVDHAASLRKHATSLRHLCCVGLPTSKSNRNSDSDEDPLSCWRSFCAEFLAVHPPLRRVSIRALDGDCLKQTFEFFERHCPKLLVEEVFLHGSFPNECDCT